MLNILLFALIGVALPPKPAHYVTDPDGILGSQRAQALDQKLAQFERDTSTQVLVYVDRNLPPDTTLEVMGAATFHAWGVGQKGKDNGAILFVFTGARKMRIEVGYGLEASLTDAKSKRILSTIVKPRLQQGDAAGAIEAGTDAILATVRGQEFKGSGRTVAETRSGAPAWSTPLLLWFRPLLLTIFFVAGFAVLWSLRWRKKGSQVRHATADAMIPLSSTDSSPSSSSESSFSTFSSDSSSSDSSSSDSSSDFSGGGGDGGGGGASDSW